MQTFKHPTFQINTIIHVCVQIGNIFLKKIIIFVQNILMSYAEAKARYAAIGVDTEAAIARLKTVPISLHCWQGDDVRGFDTDPTKPLTGGTQTTGNYPGRARTPEELMADIWAVI